MQYVEEASLSPDEIELGIAQLVQLPPSNSTLDAAPDKEADRTADYSISDYEASPKSAGDSFSDKRLSPGRYLPMTGSGLERGIALLASPSNLATSMRHGSRQSLPSNLSLGQGSLRLAKAMTLSESEWISHSPSPARTRAANLAPRRERSQQSEKVSGRSLFGGLRRRKFNGSPRKLAGVVLGGYSPKPGDDGNPVQRGMGHWI
jgi:hypothetical protein